jgi:hypothetical protein
MFDGFKIFLFNSAHVLQSDKYTKYINITDENGELIKTIYKYKGINFIHYDKTNTIILSGSFHYYFNEGVHNYNKFSFENFIVTVKLFLEEFDIESSNCILKNVEFGLNLWLKYPVNNVLNCMVFHKNKTPLKMSETDFRFVHQQYKLKIYNKSEQFKNLCKGSNVFRFEFKLIKMNCLNNIGIYTLDDLLNVGCLSFFKKELLKCWKDILMYDFTIDESKLTFDQKNELKNYKNPSYWQGLNSNRRYRPKQKIKAIINKYSEQVHRYIYNEIKKDLFELCKH